MKPLPWIEEQRDGIQLSSDPARIDLAGVHAFLTDSYWSRGIPIETVARSIEHSLCFGLYDGGAQVGFARFITDRATYARLMDVYVLDSHRGRGLGEWLVGVALDHPDLQGLKMISLATRDAQGLYERFGFRTIGDGGRAMAWRDPDPYGQKAASQPDPSTEKA
ncbi:MAG: GNAT family N-acetyltransferase [Deltaproteobacteria bacterium]|nr:GNAT family N-acetyltransferase [Deltaproteobacteria bacterium]MBW2413775.1 GNAT family N-acetyltransferase [Deltaproteobacteria bacterium]